jgi:phosphonate transport system ATP-binding protein
MIKLDRVAVTYFNGIRALKSTTLGIRPGEFVVLLGRSGAGKSTLLRCLNGMVRPTEGRVIVEGIGDLAERVALRRHRRRTGMVFQNHHLIERRSALANVLTGRLGHHSSWRTLFPLPAADKLLALDCLARVDLLDRALTRIDELSGGQRQRVGIARALCQQPTLILADEPVASLDPATAVTVLSLLKDICAKDGIAMVVSLHQVELAQRFADRIVGIANGAVVTEIPVRELTPSLIDEIYRVAADEHEPSSPRPRSISRAIVTQPAAMEATP